MGQHPGISVHHIAVGGGMVVSGVRDRNLLTFFFGVVEVRWFLLLSVPFAIGVARLCSMCTTSADPSK